MNLEENGARYGGKLFFGLQNSENDDVKHHRESLRHSGMIKRGEVEPIMKII